MKIAVGTTGDNLDAWVGSEFSWCPRFVIVDTDSMSYFIVSQPTLESYEEASLAAIRALAQHDVVAVIVATAQPQCRRVMNELGVDVIEGVEGLTVRQAVERYLSAALYTPEGGFAGLHHGRGHAQGLTGGPERGSHQDCGQRRRYGGDRSPASTSMLSSSLSIGHGRGFVRARYLCETGHRAVQRGQAALMRHRLATVNQVSV